MILTRKLIGTIESIHNKGILHHDTKADNILLGKNEDTPFIVDFGISLKIGDKRWSRKKDLLDLGFVALSMVKSEIYQQTLIDDEAKTEILQKCGTHCSLTKFFENLFVIEERKLNYQHLMNLFNN